MNTRQILFYQSGADYDIFSNVTDLGFNINIGGREYSPRSAEAVYQGIKALSSSAPNHFNIAESFFNDTSQPGAHLQKRGNAVSNPRFQSYTTQFQPSQGRNYGFLGQPFTFELKEQLMYEILLCKFTQNPALLKALLNTNNDTIIENTSLASYDDAFWGNGKNGNGRNALGMALMRVREDLQRELNEHQVIAVRNILSHDLTNQLSIPPSTPSPIQFITPAQLAQTPAARTVAAFHTQRTQASVSKPIPVTNYPSEEAERKRRAAEAAQFAAHSPAPSNLTYGKSFDVPIADRSKLSTMIRLKEATNDKGLHVYFDQENRMQFIFSNKESADKFAKNFGNVWRNQGNNMHFSLGQNQEEFVFNKLGISTHGLTDPRPFSEAIRFEFHQPPLNQPSRQLGR